MKNNMKKLLAFLCAVVLFVTAVFTGNTMYQAQAEDTASTETTSTEPTPVELYGFENVTLKDFVHHTSGSTMGETDCVCGVDNTYKLKSHDDFNKKLFTAWVKFTDPDTTQWWLNRICIGGTASNGWGLSVALTNNGNSLIVSDADTKIASPKFEKTIEGTEVGVDSFLNTEFLLQIGYEYLDTDSDGANDAVRVLVYVNGNEALNEVIENCDMTTLGNYVRFSLDNQACTIGVKSVELPIKPVELDGFTNVSVEDFTYVTGGAMAEKEHTWDVNNTCYLTNGTDFNKKLFTANVKFSYNSGVDAWNTRIHVGGKSQYTGLAVYTNETGSELTIKEMNSGDDALATFSKTVSNTTAGVTSFLEFLLQIGYEYLDTNHDGTNDAVRVLVYANGNNIVDETIQSCNMSVLGNYLGLNCEDSSSKIGVSTFKASVEPVTLSSHDTVTISDFQDSNGTEMESKAYDYDAATPNSRFYLKDGSTGFNNKLLSMRVKFGYKEGATPSWETRMAIGAESEVGGLLVYVTSDGNLHIDDKVNPVHNETIKPADAGVSSFLNTPFIFQMSFADTASGLEIGVYINGKLCVTYTWSGEYTNEYTSYINLNRGVENSFITVNSIDNEEFPSDPLTQPDSTFKKITFGSFGYTDGTYSSVEGSYKEDTNIDKTVLCGKVQLVGNDFFTIRLGGKDNSWDGLYLAPLAGGDSMEVKWRANDSVVKTFDNFTSEVAGVKFIGQNAYDLMISIEVLDGTNNVQFGVWFNNKLYGDQYYVVENVGDQLGNLLGMSIPTGGTITLGSVKELLQQPDAGYEKVTFQNFAIKDGEYDSKAADFIFESALKTKDNLDGIVVCGDIFLTDNGDTNNYSLILGEKNSNTWYGIHMWIQDANMSVSAGGDNSISINSTDAGLGSTFDGQDISLMWSVDFIDGDEDSDTTENDIKIGLWFNGFLYQNQYFTIYNAGTAADFGNTFAVCCPGDEDTITINSAADIMNLPGEEFGKLSLPDFVHNGTTDDRMASGSFSTAVVDDTWYVAGNAKDHTTLDKKVVSFDILQNGVAGTDTFSIRIGGNGNHWYGLALNTQTNGNMLINWFDANNGNGVDWQTISVSEAAVSSFVNETFNLTVSMEALDVDGDGSFDVKVRIWFNKIPYVHDGEDSYIFYGCGSQLGNILAMKAEDNDANDNGIANISFRTEKGYQSNPYYYENIAEYRGTTKTAPEAPAGYVFSGWYTDENYTKYLEPTVTSGSAYAKFVEEDVLSAKPQIKVTKNTDGTVSVPTDKTDLRVVTTVDSLEYRRISFYIAKEQNGVYGTEFNAANSEEDPRLVYEKLYAIGNNSETIEYVPTVFSWMSDYFKAFTLTEIPKDDYGVMIKVTPYWITMDGTEVRGKVLETCVDDYGKNKSQAVSVNFIGDDTLPITGYWGPYVAQDANDVMLFPEYVTDDYFKMIADSGVNVIISCNLDYKGYPSLVKKALELGEKYGIGIYVEDSTLDTLTTKEAVVAQLANYKDYKSFAGIYLVDEPGTESYRPESASLANDHATLAGFLNELGIYTYVNLYPVMDDTTDIGDQIAGTDDQKNYQNYVAEVNETLNPVALMWDMYPFVADQSEMDLASYFWNMNEIRTQAQADNKPFWAYVQAGGNWNDGSTYFNTTTYYPTEGQFNWNMNTSLAFGAQGIQYFPLIQPYFYAYAGTDADDRMWDFNRNSLIGAFGNKTEWYDYAQAANTHVGAIDGVLMNSYSTQIIALGDAQKDTTGLSGVTTSAAYEELKSVTDGADVLIGCFDYKGKTALYVVNYAYDATQEVTLEFTGTYDITKIENAVASKESAASIELDMTAGEGILLVIE